MTLQAVAHAHDHTHAPEHTHDHEHVVETPHGASHGASVMADVGGHFGAVVIHTRDTMNRLEIEIRLAGQEWDGTHTAVRERVLPGTVMWAAFFGSVHEGRYELRVRGDGARSVLVDVHGGEVTEVDW